VSKNQILEVVRPLCRFAAGLNEYVCRTDTLTETASAIRQALLEAREPDKLLFSDLPRACGVSAFKARGRTNAETVETFVRTLQDALTELQRCYENLLGELGGVLGRAFGIDQPVQELRRVLAERAVALKSWVADPQLMAFLDRVADSQLEDSDWLEALSALLSQRPPASWRDGDRARFELRLAGIVRLFQHVEVLAFGDSEGKNGGPNVGGESVRLGVTSRDAKEVERVVRIPAESRPAVDRVHRALRSALEEANANGGNEVAVAALAKLAQEILE